LLLLLTARFISVSITPHRRQTGRWAGRRLLAGGNSAVPRNVSSPAVLSRYFVQSARLSNTASSLKIPAAERERERETAGSSASRRRPGSYMQRRSCSAVWRNGITLCRERWKNLTNPDKSDGERL